MKLFLWLALVLGTVFVHCRTIPKESEDEEIENEDQKTSLPDENLQRKQKADGQENGKKVNKCLGIMCIMGTVCKKGKCVPLCPSKCKTDEFCYEGKCLPLISLCPSDTPYNPIYCSSPRPDIKACPIFNYIVAPKPIICGVNAKGQRFDFVRDCEACMDKSIVYYLDRPCSQAPTVCQDYQFCNEGMCMDKCAYMKCANGYICYHGQCITQPKQCKVQNDCQPNETCTANLCLKNR